MASIHRDSTKPYWFCCFYDPEGFRRKRSTGTDNARVARTICAAVERASSLARDNKLSSEKGFRLIRDTCSAIEETHGKLAANRAHDVLKSFVEEFIKIAGGEFTSYTIKSWLQSWIASRTDATKATLITYDQVIKLFLKHLGQRANRPLTTLQPKEIEDFKIVQTKRVAPSTVNRAIKVLKASLNNAVARRLLEFNPAEHVAAIDTDPAGRRPFTSAELTKLLTAADSKELNEHLKTQGAEWRTMILLGFYTGLRLRDCANLTWREVDLLKSSLVVKTEKTGRIQVLPMADPLTRHVHTLAGDNPDAPLCPTLRGKKASKLSAAFHEVMAKAGLVEKRTHQGTGKGRDAARATGRISFHSLRYNTTSALKSAGVSESVAMDIVGHETEAVSRNYTKIADDAKRVAINKLPDITL